MSERTDVLTHHRRRVLEGDSVHVALAASLAEVKRRGRRVSTHGNMDAQRVQSLLRSNAANFFWSVRGASVVTHTLDVNKTPLLLAFAHTLAMHDNACPSSIRQRRQL